MSRTPRPHRPTPIGARAIALALLTLLPAGGAEAGCSDSARPRVNWTDCSKDRLLLDQQDLTGADLT